MKALATFLLALSVPLLLASGLNHSVRAQSGDAPTPTVTSTPEPTLTPTPTATPTPQTYMVVQGENIAAMGVVNASAKNPGLGHVNDGDAGTMWTAQDFAPQWFSIEFESFHLVSKIELVVTQSEAGLTTLEIFVDPPRRINKVYVRNYYA